MGRLRKLTVPKRYELVVTDQPLEKEYINFILSDLHVGHKIHEAEGDTEAKARHRQVLDNLLINTIKTVSHLGYDIQGVNVFMLGDMVEGEGIFRGQPWECFRQYDQHVIAFDGLSSFLYGLHDYTHSPLSVYCVAGNHGRTSFHNSKMNNYDVMLYKTLEIAFANKDWIDFTIFDDWKGSALVHCPEHNAVWKYFMTHGYGIKSYAKIPHYGIQQRVKDWEIQYGPNDLYLLGHFHQSIYSPVIGLPYFVNGGVHTRYIEEQLGGRATEEQWMFGCGSREVTWKYKVSLE